MICASIAAYSVVFSASVWAFFEEDEEELEEELEEEEELLELLDEELELELELLPCASASTSDSASTWTRP